jgi:hypothetical protein
MLTRAERRRIARIKAPCPLCGIVVGHRNMAVLRGFPVHDGCKRSYLDAQQRARAEGLGLQIVDAGALLGGE